MTKMVRIENADTSNHKLRVQTWQKGPEGQPDTMTDDHPLDNPADLSTFWVHSTQYLVVKEAS